jgi:hypothetical protein
MSDRSVKERVQQLKSSESGPVYRTSDEIRAASMRRDFDAALDIIVELSDRVKTLEGKMSSMRFGKGYGSL